MPVNKKFPNYSKAEIPTKKILASKRRNKVSYVYPEGPNRASRRAAVARARHAPYLQKVSNARFVHMKISQMRQAKIAKRIAARRQKAKIEKYAAAKKAAK